MGTMSPAIACYTRLMHTPLRAHPEAQHGESCVEYKQFITKLIASEPLLRILGYDIADDGAEKSYDGYCTTAHATSAQQAEGKEAEQGTIGVAGHGEDQVDNTRRAPSAKGYDDKCHHNGYK